VAERRYLRHRQIDGRTLGRPSAQMRRLGEVTVSLVHRESPHRIPDRPSTHPQTLRYMWSINTSVARAVISFNILAILFCIGIAVRRKFSHGCPFQTPALVTLRALLGNKETRKLLATPDPTQYHPISPYQSDKRSKVVRPGSQSRPQQPSGDI